MNAKETRESVSFYQKHSTTIDRIWHRARERNNSKKTNERTKSVQLRVLSYSKARACLRNKDPGHHRQPRSFPSLLTLRRNVLHFKKVSDILCVIRRQASPVAVEQRAEGKETRKGGGRHERGTRANLPLKSVVIHGPVLRAKKNIPPATTTTTTTDASRVALHGTSRESARGVFSNSFRCFV